MAHKFDPANLARLESAERLELLPVDRVVSLARISPGTRVLDVGCGPGVFTIPLAAAVGLEGEVTAVDLEQVMVDACQARVEEAGLENVRVLRSEESRLPLPSAAYDLAFACHLLHELEDAPALLGEVRRVLRPGGRFISVDWEKIDMPIGPPTRHRFTPEEATALLSSAGFEVSVHAPVTWANFMLIAAPLT